MSASHDVRQDVNADLGFGSVVSRESRRRLLNRDGTFNVRRQGLRFWESLSLYHYLVTMTWRRFLWSIAGTYILLNALFAVLYVACGADALTGFEKEPVQLRFVDAFFFSVQTLGTIGYGSIAPSNLAANLVVTLESLVGLIAFALVAGITFARFSRPTARIVFSDRAIVAPYGNISALMFRIVNQRKDEIVNLEAKVLLTRRKRDGGPTEREFLNLALERDRVAFFPLSWTIVHPIDEKSPLWGTNESTFYSRDPELLVLLNGFEETFSQNVHARSSYKSDEIVWGARFRNMFLPPEDDGEIRIDIGRLSEIEPYPAR